MHTVCGTACVFHLCTNAAIILLSFYHATVPLMKCHGVAIENTWCTSYYQQGREGDGNWKIAGKMDNIAGKCRKMQPKKAITRHK